MREYKTNAKVRLPIGGRLQLTPAQAAARKHRLKVLDADAGLYEITNTVEFKAGEKFGYEGDAPKAALQELVTPSGQTAVDIKQAQAEQDKGGPDGDNDTSGIEPIVEAIAALDPQNDDHWTSDGKPQVRVLEEVLGANVTADERDQAWALHLQRLS